VGRPQVGPGRSTVRRLGADVVLGLASLAVALLLAEGACRVLVRHGALRPSLRGASLPQEPYSPRLVRSADPDLFLENDRTDPLVNAEGFRGPAVPQAKPPGTARVVVLGDSVAFGLGVPYEDTLAAQLQSLLPSTPDRRWEVLDFAVNGYGTPQEVKVLETRALAWAPDVVVLVYVVNDPVPIELLTAVFAQLADQERSWPARLAQRSELAGQVLDRMRLLRQARTTTGSYAEAYKRPEAWNRVTAGFAKLVEIGRSRSLPIFVAIFPLLYDLDHYPFVAYHAQVRTALDAAGLPWIDLRDVLATRDATAFRIHPLDDTHPNARGHREAAEAIRRALAAHEMVP